MALTIPHTATANAVAAATTQPGWVTALVSAWAGGDVTVRFLTASAVVMRVQTYSAFAADNASTPRAGVMGALLATTELAQGTPALIEFVQGSTVIFTVTAGVGTGDFAFARSFIALSRPRLDAVDGLPAIRLLAPADLPLTAPPPAPSPPAPTPPAPTPPAPAPVPGTTLTTLALTSTLDGVQPFACMHAFVQGHIPTGSDVVAAATGASVRAAVMNRWPDGSVKLALLGGTATFASGAASLALSAGTAAVGTALTGAALQTAMGANTAVFDCGAFGTATFSGADFASPFQTHGATSQFAEFIYRKPVGSDAHLVAWLHCRLWVSGAVEVLPVIENGYLLVAGPTNKNATYTFTLGGTQRFSAVIDLKHHQRTPLVTGTALSHWLGADPGVVPLHDAAYLQNTELVPSYFGPLPAGQARVLAQPATYTPLQAGSFTYLNDDQAQGGYQRPIGLLPEHDALHLMAAESDRVATFKSVVRNGFSAGRYGIHYRDENTFKLLRFQDHPNTNINDSQGFKDVGGGSIRTAAAAGGNPPGWDVAHSPSVGYMAYLLTGWCYFKEEVQFAATANFLGNGTNAILRNGSQGLVQPCLGAWQTRSSAWDWRAQVLAMTVTPADDHLYADLLNRTHNNIDDFWQRYVNTPNNAFGFVDNGTSAYNGTNGQLAPWQQDFVTASWGWAKSLGLPVDSTRRARMDAFFAWTAKSVVGRLGTSGTFPFENANRFNLKLTPGVTNVDFRGGTGPWPADWATIYGYTTPLATTPDNPIVTPGGNVLATEFDATAASRGIWANLQPAISYAVRHGVAGASAAYARMTGATNFVSMLQTQFLNNDPVWGVKPLIDPVALPTYLQGSSLFSAVAVPNSRAGIPQSVLRAWGCLVPIQDTNRLVSAANGGHTDSSDNGVYEIDIGMNSPTGWVTKIAPSSPVTANASHNPDGKPGSRHGYQHAHYVPQRNRVILVGMRGWSSDGGDAQNAPMDGVNVGTLTYSYDAAGTFPDLGFASRGFGISCDPLTGNIWTNGGWLWTQAMNTWSNPGTYTGTVRWGWQKDALRDRFAAFQWRDGQGFGATGLKAQIMNPATGAATDITWASDAETVAALAEITAANPDAGQGNGWPNYEASCYDSARDKFIYYFGHITNPTLANQWYEITPQSGSTGWTMERRVLTGLPLTQGQGINGLLRYMPLLKGVYVQPNSLVGTNFGGYVIRTSN